MDVETSEEDLLMASIYFHFFNLTPCSSVLSINVAIERQHDKTCWQNWEWWQLVQFPDHLHRCSWFIYIRFQQCDRWVCVWLAWLLCGECCLLRSMTLTDSRSNKYFDLNPQTRAPTPSSGRPMASSSREPC